MASIAIIGAGMAGLACAHALERAGVDWTVFESSDAVGGRIRTDVVDGFRLDRGFQVYLTAYRSAGEILDYPPLNFRSFRAGAEVFNGTSFASISHPLRHPIDAFTGIMTQPGMIVDLARLLPLALSALRSPMTTPPASSGTTLALFKKLGVSANTRNGFLRSFFGGVFLDRSLETDASQFEFIFSGFARGDTVVPALGMAQIPQQIAANLPAHRIRLGTPIAAITRRSHGYCIRTNTGSEEHFESVVLAADMNAAHNLEARVPNRAWCGTTTFHWACAQSDVPAPLCKPVLFLDGTGNGPVNHAACISSVAPEYAPEGQALISLNLVGTDWTTESMSSLMDRMKVQMEQWFGTGAMRGWRLLRIDRIPRALPRQHPTDLAGRPLTEIEDRYFLAGDHVTDASIDGAVRSGLQAAERVLTSIRQ